MGVTFCPSRLVIALTTALFIFLVSEDYITPSVLVSAHVENDFNQKHHDHNHHHHHHDIDGKSKYFREKNEVIDDDSTRNEHQHMEGTHPHEKRHPHTQSHLSNTEKHIHSDGHEHENDDDHRHENGHDHHDHEYKSHNHHGSTKSATVPWNIWIQALGATFLISAIPAIALMILPIDMSSPSSASYLKVSSHFWIMFLF